MENQSSQKRQSGMIAGVLFIVFGVLLLVHTLGADNLIPHWLVSWPMILILVGVISGIRHRFTQPGPYMCIAVGVAFLAGQIDEELLYGQLIFPAVLLAVGLYLIFGKKGRCGWVHKEGYRQEKMEESGS